MSGVAVAHVTAALQAAGLLRSVRGELPGAVRAITDDSRAVTPDALFIAVRGTAFDGHEYLSAADAAGATIAIVEDPERTSLPVLVVTDSRRAAAVAAAAFYSDPARALTTIAVTGTNGKTTTVAILRHLLDHPHEPAASIGTLGVLVGSAGNVFPGGAGLTTPGPVEMQRVLRALVDEGVRVVALEASSHALDQRRVDGVAFDAAVFTNLTRDHLDYHQSMDAYLAAKSRLAAMVKREGITVVNADDRAWDALVVTGRRLTFGLGPSADVRAERIRYEPRGSAWSFVTPVGSYDVRVPLIGDFNVANALAAAAGAIAAGAMPRMIAERLATVPQVPGRLERLSDAPVVLRDYAHTPDALERALRALRPFVPDGRIILVFGCGGDRDPGKRPLMGAVAEQHADYTIVTSDNPRTEDPERIIDAIEAGMTRRDGARHERIEDRRAAIARAIERANASDVVLLAGKGHETYQVRDTRKLPFDEALIVRDILGDTRISTDRTDPTDRA